MLLCLFNFFAHYSHPTLPYIQADDDSMLPPLPEMEPSFGSPRSSVVSATSSAARPQTHPQRVVTRKTPSLGGSGAPSAVDLSPKSTRLMSLGVNRQGMRSQEVDPLGMNPQGVNPASHIGSTRGGSGRSLSGGLSAPAASSTPAALSIPWLSLMEEEDDKLLSEEDSGEGPEEGDGQRSMRNGGGWLAVPPRSESSFASDSRSQGGRSISFGGGGGAGGGHHAHLPTPSSATSLPRGAEGGSSKPAVLAESVFDGVKSKLRRLQDEIRGRDDTIARMNKVWELCICGGDVDSFSQTYFLPSFNGGNLT